MIQLHIQDPMLPEKTITNTYELIVHSYHGDADHDEYNSTYYKACAKDMEQLHMALEICEAYEAAGRPYAITKRDWIKFIEASGVDTSSETYIEDWVSESLLAWDMTNNGQFLTTYSGYDLVFHDVNGLKRPVHVEHTDGTN